MTVPDLMDSIQVFRRVEQLIELSKTDAEAARSGAERLRIEVLTAIAQRKTPSAWAVAAAVLRTVDDNILGV